MGTSSPFGGQSGDFPLVPSFVEEGGAPPAAPPEPPRRPPIPPIGDPGRFSAARGNFSRFAGSGVRDRASLGRTVSQYVGTLTNGAQGASNRMGSARGASGRLLGFLADAATRGATEALTHRRLSLRVCGARASPQFVAEREAELALWEGYLPETRYVGEVGLDAGPRFYESIEAQKRVFRTVLERCARAGGKILSVHTVRGATTLLDMIGEQLPLSRGKVVLHWFTGSQAEAHRATGMGFYFSIDREMTVSERGRALIAELPSDRLLTKTDGPFTRIDGSSAEPVDVGSTVKVLAGLRGISAGHMTKVATSNLRLARS